jgi:Ca2+-transporting ATPase
VTAVRYGRRVFANLRKAIAFVIAVHLPIVGLSIVPLVLGWPMVLMPVHILFLQLIIDPACSIVFEAEPLEPGAMRMPPRRPDARLFDVQVLLRGVVQGCGLFGIVLVAYVVARSASDSDEMARALAFAVLVVSNLVLIHVNRTWAGRRDSTRPWNAAFGWIASATCVLLVLVLWVPDISGLFLFTRPSTPLLMVGSVLCVSALAWFEAAKWLVGRRAR